jgi:hypothetical protein
VNRVVVPFSDLVVILLIVILSTVASSAASAKHAAKGADPDESAIHDFILTMGKVNQYAAVSKKLQAAGAGDPVMAAEMKKVEETDVPNIEKAALIEKSPHTAVLLKANGITAREFVLIPMTVVTAGIAAAALDAKGKPPAFVNPVNIQFVRDHRAELGKLELSGSGNSRDGDSHGKDSDDKDNH